jgi:hypothetical protein
MLLDASMKGENKSFQQNILAASAASGILLRLCLGQLVSMLLLCGCELLNPLLNLRMEGTLFTSVIVEGAVIQG